jgi:hypothetical protein
MFTKVIPVSTLVAQSRWKVEFFLSHGAARRPGAFPLVPLRDVLTERREFLDPQRYPDHLFHYLGLEHVQSVTGDLAEGYEPRKGHAVLSRSKVFRRGDLLYGRLRPSLNKVFVAGGTISEGICSGEFYVLVPDPLRILPHFARSLLASRYVQDIVKGMTGGSALPRLALEDLVEIEIPLPPLAIQRQYEGLLSAQNERRRQLMAELREGPARDLDAIVSALEEGTLPAFTRSVQAAENGFENVKLPGAGDFSARGRGRPARDSDCLFS